MPDSLSSVMTPPTDVPITWEGKELTPQRMVKGYTHAAEPMQPYYIQVKRARDLRRGTLVRRIAQSWADDNPEAAEAAVSKLHQRRTLEQDLKARLGSIEPAYIRKAIGERQTDIDNAMAFQDYLNEWRTSEFGVPVQTYFAKLVEDGGFLRVRVPADVDMEGETDFFDRLSERAHAQLAESEQAGYKKDEANAERPYVKVGSDGKPQPKAKYAKLLAEPDAEKALAPMRRADRAKARVDRATQEHDLAIQRYLLQRPAATAQVYGGLDVAPVFKRGIGREQAELACAFTRQLLTVEEALEQGYGWKGMNGRLLVPRGYSETSTIGRDGCYYLYTMYFVSRDRNGRLRPCIAYTLGGYATSYGVGGTEPTSKDSIGLIDLYKEYGLEGPLWSWHWGLATHDDEPAYRGRPYLCDIADLILAIEGEEMAIRATTQVSAFTGHVEELGEALSGAQAEAVLAATLEKGPNETRALRKGKIPKPGKIETTVGKIVPFQQSQIGADAWKILASDRQALAEATAVDQAASSPGSSGHAIVVGETLAKTAKRDIRESVMEATRRDGEDQVKIWAAIERKHGYRWPIQKIEEPPGDAITNQVPRYAVAEFDPEWIGDGQFTRLACEYPDELNLAEVDLEASLADRGYSHIERVMKKMGIADPMREWQKILEWRLRNSQAYQLAVESGLAKRRGDKTMIDIVKALQAKQQMTEAGVPGASNGVPTAALKRLGEQAPQQTGQGGPTQAAAQRGGIAAGQMQTASMQHDAQGALQVGSAA